jgi:hypothetical protein
MHAKQEALPIRVPSPPMLVDEAEGRAALVEAIVLEPAELEGAGRRQHASADSPAIEAEPGKRRHQAV